MSSLSLVTFVVMKIIITFLLLITTTTMLCVSAQTSGYQLEIISLGTDTVANSSGFYTDFSAIITNGAVNKKFFINEWLKYNQTLLLENHNIPQSSIEVAVVVCPGSKIIIRNCQAEILKITSPADSEKDDCRNLCELPSDLQSTDVPLPKLPLDIDPRLVVSVVVENNIVIMPDDAAVTHKGRRAIDISLFYSVPCAERHFNNTRFSLSIKRNNISAPEETGIMILLLNADVISSIHGAPRRVFLNTFMRDSEISENYILMRKCRGIEEASGIDRYRVHLWFGPHHRFVAFYDAKDLRLKAEGFLNIDDNVMTQPKSCQEKELMTGEGATRITISDSGASRHFLPLRVYFRRNTVHLMRQMNALLITMYHSRVGYFEKDFSSLPTTDDEAAHKQLNYFNNRRDAEAAGPRIHFEENNIYHEKLTAVATEIFISALFYVEDRNGVPRIDLWARDYPELGYSSSSSSFATMKNSDEHFMNKLRYHPERVATGAVIIRNNFINYRIPWRLLPSKDELTNGAYYVKEYVILARVGTMELDIARNWREIYQYPVNYFKEPLKEGDRTIPIDNMSYSLVTIAELNVTGNTFENHGSRAMMMTVLDGSTRVRTFWFSENKIFVDFYNEGPVDPLTDPPTLPHQSGLFTYHNCTIHRFLFVNNFFNYTMNTTMKLPRINDFNLLFMRTDQVFGVVQLLVSGNIFLVNSTGIGAQFENNGFRSNYFDDIYAYPFIEDPFFLNEVEFNNNNNKKNIIPRLLPLQRRHRSWEIRDNSIEYSYFNYDLDKINDNSVVSGSSSFLGFPLMYFPGGNLIFDNITMTGVSVSTYACVNTGRMSMIEVDRFVITNIRFDMTVFSYGWVIKLDGPVLFIRKQFFVENISIHLSPLHYGKFDDLAAGSMVHEGVAIFGRWVDVDSTLANLPSDPSRINPADDTAMFYYRPPFAQYYRSVIDLLDVDVDVNDESSFVDVQVSNIFARLENGITNSFSTVTISVSGLKTRNNTAVIKNVTAILGRQDGNYSDLQPLADSPFPLPDFLLRRAYEEGYFSRRSLVSLIIYSELDFYYPGRYKLDERVNYNNLRDPRTLNLPFPPPDSTTRSTPNTLVIHDSKYLVDSEAVGNLVHVKRLESTVSGGTKDVGDVPVNTRVPTIVLRRITAETFDLEQNLPPSSDRGLFLSRTDVSSILQLRQHAAVMMVLDRVFAPAFDLLFRYSLTYGNSNTSLAGVRVVDADGNAVLDDFLSSSIQNYASDRQLTDESRSKIYNDFTVGRCTAFLGNRPLSSFERIFQSMSPAPPLNKGPFESASSGAFRSQVDFTPCLNETKTITLTKTITRSKSVPGNPENISYTPSQSLSTTATYYEIPPPPPFVLPGQEEGSAMLAAAAVAGVVAVSITPSAAAAVARMTSVLDVVNGIAKNDCSGQSADEAPDLVSSPFQISFGPSGGGYLLGTVVGNMLLNAVLFLLTLTGYWLFLRFYRKKQRLQVPFLSMKGGALARFLRDSLSFTGLVVGTEILLYPTLAAGLVMTVRNHSDSPTSFGARAVAAVLTGGVSVVCVSWLWKLLKARDSFEKFKRTAGNRELMSSVSNNNKKQSDNGQRLLRRDNHEYDEGEFPVSGSNNTSCIGAVWKKVKLVLAILTGEEGVWYFPSSLVGRRAAPSSSSSRTSSSKETEHTKSPKLQSRIVTPDDKYLWYYAEPLIEGFTDRFPRFMAVEFGVQGLLAVAIAVGEVIGAGRSGCVVQAGFVLLIFFLYLVATLMWRPYNDLLSRVTTPATTIIELITIVIALMDVEIAALSGLVVALSSMQMIVAVVSLLQWVIAVGWPAFRAVVLRGRNRKSRSTSAAGERNNTRVSMSMRTFSNAHDNSTDRQRHPSSAVSSRPRSGSTRGDGYRSSSNGRSRNSRVDEELLVNDVLMRQSSLSSRQRRERPPGTQSTSDGRRDRSQNSNDDQERRRRKSSRSSYNEESDQRHAHPTPSNEERTNSSSIHRNRQPHSSSSSPTRSSQHHDRRSDESKRRNPNENTNRHNRRTSSKNTASQMRYADI